ncbi:MAG: hypothetical protein ABIB11_02225 [Candidatus Omnitrophota bacterium]
MSIINEALKKAATTAKNNYSIRSENSRTKLVPKKSTPDTLVSISPEKKSTNKKNILILSTALLLLLIGISALISKNFLTQKVGTEHLVKTATGSEILLNPAHQPFNTHQKEKTTSGYLQQTLAANETNKSLGLLAAKCTINGIIHQGGTSSAIINDKVYNIGDSFENAKIINIKETGIVIEADGHKQEISIE